MNYPLRKNKKKSRQRLSSEKDNRVFVIDSHKHEEKPKFGWFLKLFKKLIHFSKKIGDTVNTKKEERLTIMFIPHNEKNIKNYHISNFSLSIIIGVILLCVGLSSIFIINHTSTLQEIDKLKLSQKDAKIQFSKIKGEINNISRMYDRVKHSFAKLNSLIEDKEYSQESSFFGQGGKAIPFDKIDYKELEMNNILPDVADHKIEQKKDELKKETIPTEIFILNRILEDMKVAKKPLQNLQDYVQQKLRFIRNSPTLWPVHGYVINPYGLVRKSNTLDAIFNIGIDIAANPGAKVVATALGYVVEVSKEIDRTWKIKIRHNYGYETVYKGMARVNVQADDSVTKGETIGFLGYSKDSLQSVLYYQVYIGIEPQNPLSYMNYIAK